MHQIFYIDVDEEITSIISKLKKSKTKENIFVVPRRALILQSVVSLKVLKKQAEKFKKQIMIVTQDEQGRAITEKIGILSQGTMDGIEEGDELKAEIQPRIKNSREKNDANPEKGRKLLGNIGSDSFYNKPGAIQDSADFLEENNLSKKDNVDDSDSVKKLSKKNVAGQEKRKRNTMSDILSSSNKSSPLGRNLPANEQEVGKKKKEIKNNEPEKNLDPRKEIELAEFYYFTEKSQNVGKKDPIVVSGKLKKVFVLFGIISLLAVLLVGLFLFLPKAEVAIKLSSRFQANDLEVEGDSKATVADMEKNNIPVRIIEKEKEKKASFKASGKGEASDQKAKGVITIYNEYSTSPQLLVATTRFSTNDGKIFRLIKGVSVPGMANVGGKLNPGVIEAEVLADKSGEEFNIQPTDFSIPGFQGSPKFSKFYARSRTAMIGGGTKGNGSVVISAADIDFARKETEKNLKSEILEEIKGELKEGEVFSEDATETAVMDSDSPEAGVMTDNFDFWLKIKTKTLVFFETDLKKVVENSFEKKPGEKISRLKIEYGKMTPEFEGKTINIKVHGKALLEQELDEQKIKAELLGKNGTELEALIQGYSQIKGLEVEFWPEFLPGKIPSYEKRVKIEIIHDNLE